ncbi:FUSC family protein [Streptomyces sp. NPDC002143]
MRARGFRPGCAKPSDVNVVGRRSRPAFGGLRRLTVQEVRGGARMMVCATLSWYLAVELGINSAPVAAVLPAVFTLSGIPLWAPRLGLYRLGSVLLGVCIAAVALRWLPVSTLSLAVVVSAGYLASLLLRIDGVPSQQVLVSAVLVFGVPVSGYPEQRVLENLVGIAVVVLLGPLLWPPDPCRLLSSRLDAYRDRLDDLLKDVGRHPGRSPLRQEAGQAEGLWQQPHDLARDLDRARAALRWSVTHRRSIPALDELGHRIHLADRTAAPLHCLSAQLHAADGPSAAGTAAGPPAGPAPDGPGPLLEAVRHALIVALEGVDPTEPITRARMISRQYRPARTGPGPGPHDSLLRDLLLLVLETLDDYCAAHFTGR